MAQLWYQKATVQAALTGGAFVIIAAIMTPVVGWLLSDKKDLDENELATAISQQFENIISLARENGEVAARHASADAVVSVFKATKSVCFSNPDRSSMSREVILDDLSNAQECENLVVELFAKRIREKGSDGLK